MRPVPGRVGVPLTSTVATELAPSVHDDLVVWVDPNGRPGGISAQGSQRARRLGDTSVGLVFGGDATVTLEYGPSKIVRIDDAGRRTVLGSFDPSTPKIGLGGSDEGAVWASAEKGTVSYVDEKGRVTTAGVPGVGSDNVVSVSAGDGSVGLGTERGRVLLWTPGEDVEQVGRLPSAVLATATYGNRVLAIDDELNATAFDAKGSDVRLPRGAVPFGAAMNRDYAVWTQATGRLRGGVADAWVRAGGAFPDTDLFMYSFASGRTQPLVTNPGQQGFPGLSGNRLVWQDTSDRGNDILTAVLKPGL